MILRSLGLLLLLLPGKVAAQSALPLDPTCTVTVGNQTAFVRVDGTFFVPNISIFQSRDTGVAPQLYRVRATCLRDGRMETGQSPFFPLTPGQTTFAADVLPGALSPIPARIDTSASAEFLPQGATAQITVTATLPDGRVVDVTSRAAGTTYLSTNPRLLSVTEEGLVTGVNASTTIQTGTVAVLHEGNLATIDFTAVGPSNDFDNDGMPNDYEDLFGLNKLANDAGGDLDGDGLTNLQELQRGTLPNNPDTDMDTIPDGIDGDPLHPEEAAPAVRFAAPADSTLVEGQTLTLTAEAMDDGLLTGLRVLVNGVPFASSATSPLSFTFTVPYATTGLDLTAEATDSVGNVGTAAASLVVAPDPLTTAQGAVVDVEGDPVPGAAVALQLAGLRGEFFDFNDPLSSLPNLAGLTPAVIRLLSAVNLRNPDNLLSADTFGVGLAPDFAARFSGLLRVPAAGSYTFRLGADDGARLTIAGTPVVEVAGSGDFAEAQGTVTLPAGSLPLTLEYFQSVGDAELQLSVAGPGGGPFSAVTLSRLLQSPDPFAGTTEADGLFSFPGVPTILGNLQARAEATIDGQAARGSSAALPPAPGGVTDLGPVVVASSSRILIFGDRAERNLLTADLQSLGHMVTNVVTLPLDLSGFDTIWHVGAFVPLTAAERSRLAAFVDAGGGLHLTGERPCCESLNDSLELFVNGVVAGGGVQVGSRGDIGGPYSFNPNALDGVTAAPNLLAAWNPSASGGMGGLGALPDPNILATGAGAIPVGGVWACGELAGGRGRLTLLMDVNWFANTGRLQPIENIQQFLAAPCGP